MAQHTHDCDELAVVLRALVSAIDGDAGLRKSNQYRTGDLVNLPLFQAAKKALDGAHGSFRYREQLEAAAKTAAYVVLDTPRAPLPEISRERLRDLDDALEAAEPGWRESPFFWHKTHSVAAEEGQ